MRLCYNGGVMRGRFCILAGILAVLLVICACGGEAGENLAAIPHGDACGQKYDAVKVTTDITEYELGETVLITITNFAVYEIGVKMPFYTIERYDDGVWVEIRRVLCPCDMRCTILSHIVLAPQGNISYQWGQKETWCCNSSSLFQKTCSEQVPSGTYRVTSSINDSATNCSHISIYSAEFTIN